MSDLFGIARSGIKAYKESLATTGQNIANVGNTNYARREANLTEIKSSSADVLSVNSHSSYGVMVDGISRAFDKFIEVQFQNASSDLSFSTSQTLILEKLEKVLRPNEMSVSKKLQDFFASLSTVSEDASNLAARHIAVDAGLAVATSITTVANGINDLKRFVVENVIDNVRDFNNILQAVNQIQKEILGNTTYQLQIADLDYIISRSFPWDVIGWGRAKKIRFKTWLPISRLLFVPSTFEKRKPAR